MAPQPHHVENVAAKQVVDAKQTISTESKIQRALHVLQQPPTAKSTQMACKVVLELLLTEHDCRVALDANAVPILTAALLYNGTSLNVMADGISALLQLSTNDKAQIQLLRREILAPLVCAMRQHKSQPELMFISLALLVRLASVRRRGQSVLFVVQAMELAIEVMMTHPRDAPLQCQGCELIHHMADNLIAQQRLVVMGAVEILVAAVQQFPQNRRLQQRALPTLCRLCEVEQTRTLITKVGGVAAVLNALTCLYEDAPVSRHGCTLLWELSLCSAARKQIVAADAQILVKKILQLHPVDQLIITNGRALLSKIGARGSPSKVGATIRTSPMVDAFRKNLNQHLATRREVTVVMRGD